MQPLHGQRNELHLDAAHPVVGTVGSESQIAGHGRVEDLDLRALPVLLVHGAVDLQMTVEPFGLPPNLVVGQRVGRVVKGRGREYSAERRGLRDNTGTAIEATGTEALRPGVVRQDVRPDVPGEIRASLGAAESLLEVIRVQIAHIAERSVIFAADLKGSGRAHAGIGRDKGLRGGPAVVDTMDFAAEAARVRALLERVHTVVANASSERQSLRDEVEVHGDEPRPLGIATLNVVEEHVARGANVGVADSGQ